MGGEVAGLQLQTPSTRHHLRCDITIKMFYNSRNLLAVKFVAQNYKDCRLDLEDAAAQNLYP